MIKSSPKHIVVSTITFITICHCRYITVFVNYGYVIFLSLSWLGKSDLIYPYPSSLFHWYWGNQTVGPVSSKQPRRLRVNEPHHTTKNTNTEKQIFNLNLAKSRLPITYCSVVKSFWKCAQITTVSLSCTVQIFERVDKWNAYLRILSLLWVSDGYLTWASCQIRKITGCACAGNAENVFPATAG